MAVASIATWHVRPGRVQEFVSNAATGKKILEGLGGKVRVWQPVFGAQAGTVAFVVEHADIKAYADFVTKTQSDGEWQKFVQENILSNTDPTADLVSTSLVTETPGI